MKKRISEIKQPISDKKKKCFSLINFIIIIFFFLFHYQLMLINSCLSNNEHRIDKCQRSITVRQKIRKQNNGKN